MVSFTISLAAGTLAIIAGILILFFPKLTRWALGLYLLIWGILQLF